MKMWLRSFAFPFIAVILVCGIASQTWGGEKGKFRGRGACLNTKATMLEVPITPKHTLAHGEDDGILFNDTGDSFLANARYQVFWMTDLFGETATTQGYKIFTTSDGSQAFAKFEGTYSTGNITFIGGTGKYKGLKGRATYKLIFINDTLYWDILEGEYELP